MKKAGKNPGLQFRKSVLLKGSEGRSTERKEDILYVRIRILSLKVTEELPVKALNLMDEINVDS